MHVSRSLILYHTYTYCMHITLRAFIPSSNETSRTISSVMLFDTGMTVNHGVTHTGIQHGIQISAQSRSVRLWQLVLYFRIIFLIRLVSLLIIGRAKWSFLVRLRSRCPDR